MHVETRPWTSTSTPRAMQRDFDELAEDEGLDDEQQAFLTRKASHLSIVVRDEDRVEAVCRDIVTHYRERIARSARPRSWPMTGQLAWPTTSRSPTPRRR